MKHFVYRKKKDEVSERFVVPIGMVDDKLHAVDLTEYSDEEREIFEKELHDLRIDYINGIKDAGLGTNFRYFFLDNIEDLEDA